MPAPIASHARGYVIAVAPLPSGFLRSLEARGIAAAAAATCDGFYAEPRGSLAAVIFATEQAGLAVEGVRAAGRGTGWRTAARPQAGIGRGLHDCRSATWLPTAG
ncbi:MAG: hypothetical protein ACR2HN_03815 [Tepidiformaceae bacterium]